MNQDDSNEGVYRYTQEHEWVRGGADGSVRVGITDYAQEQLGDVVFVDLPEAGRHVDAGEVFGEVESTKSVSELFMPLSGEITAVNDVVTDSPELLNSDPFGDGWLIEITIDSESDFAELLDEQAYQEITEA